MATPTNPYEAPEHLEADQDQPPVVVTRARVYREMLFLAGYFIAVLVLPFCIAWFLQFL